MNGVWSILTAGLVVLLCGCAGPQAEPGSTDGTADGSSEGPLAGSLEVNVTDPGVRLTLHVTNTSSRPVEFTFPSSQRYDFVIRRAGDGEEVWRWSDGMMFTQAIAHATLAPGESWDMGAVWEAPGMTGAFTATGVLTAQDRRPEQTVQFRLP